MMSLRDIKKALRNGPFAWPGGYPMVFISADGDTLSFEGVRQEWRQVVQDYLRGTNTGWQMAAVDVNWEDADMICGITGEPIPSAYAETTP